MDANGRERGEARAEAQRRGGRVSGYLLRVIGEEKKRWLNIEHRTSNIEHRTSNIEHRTSNIEHRTSNIEHRTSNIEHRTSNIEVEEEVKH
jgi:hypothetical protein